METDTDKINKTGQDLKGIMPLLDEKLNHIMLTFHAIKDASGTMVPKLSSASDGSLNTQMESGKKLSANTGEAGTKFTDAANQLHGEDTQSAEDLQRMQSEGWGRVFKTLTDPRTGPSQEQVDQQRQALDQSAGGAGSETGTYYTPPSA